MLRSASSLSALVVAGLLPLTFPVPALAAEPISVVLTLEQVAHSEDDATVKVMFSDRREPDEGGDDADLIGWVEAPDGPTWVRAVPPGPRSALEQLLLARLHEAGVSATAQEGSDAPIGLQIRLHRYWVDSNSLVTARIDLELVKWSTRTGKKLATRRISASGMSRDPLPGAAQDAARRAMLRLERELDDELADLLDTHSAAPGFAGSGSGDGLGLPVQSLARQPGARMRRFVGFGAGARLGVETIPDREIVEVQGEFLSFELRLVAAEFFSFDWTADVVGPAVIAETRDRLPQIRTAWFLHFAAVTRGRFSLALAPGLHLTVFPDDEPKFNDHILYGAMRIGADIASPGREFGLGIYLRPQIGAAINSPGDGTRLEFYAEVTWTLYAGRWALARNGA